MVSSSLKVEAEVVDITSDTPRASDILLVDTNVWFWLAYSNASSTSTSASKIAAYSSYVTKVISSGGTLASCGLLLSELAHLIENTERDIFNRTSSRKKVGKKEFRTSYSAERAKVVREVRSVWGQVSSLAVLLEMNVTEDLTQEALDVFSRSYLDGYDLFVAQVLVSPKEGVSGIFTDDSDYACIPNISLFTANQRVIQAAASQGKLRIR